jgi:hypothetical protein
MIIKVLLFIIFVIANISLAFIDANKIKQGKRIYHGINGLIYFSFLLLVYIAIPSSNLATILGLSLLRIPVFNTTLNYFRGLPLTYLSDSTTSIIDQLTNFIPKKIGYWSYTITLLTLSLILILI